DSGDTAAPTEIIKKRAPAEDAKLLTKDTCI
ncbi:jg24714, partial [Pararge aegeria aegeria]